MYQEVTISYFLFSFLNRRLITAAKPESVAFSQTKVRELSPKAHHSVQKVKPFMSGLTPTAWPSTHFPEPVTVTNHPSVTLRQLTPAQIGLQGQE